MSVTNSIHRACLCALLSAMMSPSAATAGEILFQDNFENDTSADWSLQVGYYTGERADDYKVEWAFDYSAQDYNFFTDKENFETFKVPPAPHSNGTTKGLKLRVNKEDDEAGRFAINLYPKGKNFSGDYVMRFDCFMNHAAFADNGSGTTEYTLFGINHLGTQVNWGALLSGAIRPDFTTTAVGRAKSDGVWFGFTHDGGAAQDLWTWEGSGDGPPKYLAGTSGGIPDTDGDGSADVNEFNGLLSSIFPAPPFESAGMLAKRWVEVEISQNKDVLTWKIDGAIIASRTNASPYKSGNIMIGMADTFPGVALAKDENWVIIDNIRVERLDNRIVTVDTTDNASPASDGKTSLAEALTGLKSGDTVRFNIPGAGPHVIKTPIGGYPLITADNVTVDGYSQPGAAPNTKPVLEGNNARIQIILDSTDSDSTGSADKPNRRSTRLPYPGYGDSENAILGVLAADHVTIQGLSFLARKSMGNDADPAIYCIALIQEARDCRVQGNWFGLHPDGKTVKAGTSAVSGFRHRIQDAANQNIDTFSERLFFGTDSDGRGDLGEGNILCGHRIGLAIELPMARISGNYFNVLPDGKTFLNLDDIRATLTAVGLAGNSASVESIENGRLADSTVIGTDGNGANDANERNIFNQSIYRQWIEFYSSSARNIVVAGNHFGVGVDGSTIAAAPTEGAAENLIALPGTASIRFGANSDARNENLEGNIVRKAGAKNLLNAGAGVRVSIRRNTFIENGFEGFPFADAGDKAFTQYYADLVADSTKVVPVLDAVTNKVFSGSFTLGALPLYVDGIIDLYALDSTATGPYPGRWIASFADNKPEDTNLDPGAFSFDISTLELPVGANLAYTVTYSSVFFDSTSLTTTDAGSSFTGPLSNSILFSGTGPTEPIRITAITPEGANLKLVWTGSAGSFKVQRKASLATGEWTDVTTTASKTASVAAAGTSGFYRIVAQ